MVKIFSLYLPIRILFLAACEGLLIFGAIQLAAVMTLSDPGHYLLRDGRMLYKAALITVLCQLCFYYQDFYDLTIFKDRGEIIIRLLRSLGTCSILVSILYLLFPAVFLGPGVFARTVFILLGFLLAWRIGVSWISQRKEVLQTMLILGTGELATKLAAEVLNRPDAGIRIAGFVSDDPALVGKSLLNPKVLGHVSDFAVLAEREKVTKVAVAMPDSRGKMPTTQLLELKMKGVSIEEASTLYERISGKLAVETLRPSWLIFSPGFQKSLITRVSKRLLETVLALVGLIVFFPAMLVIAILVKLDSKGRVFFAQERVGENGKIIKILKFRSMFANAEATTGPVWATDNDARITRVGRVIRKLRLDELPQFLNVLKGDMSFVGPRPERPEFVAELEKVIPYYSQRHRVKPGITGWAQVRYQYAASVEDTLEKLCFDLYYIKNMSIWLDLVILFQTVKIVLRRRGAH